MLLKLSEVHHSQVLSKNLAPKLWISLPDIVRCSDSLSQFKTRLKTHLFSQAFIYFFFFILQLL